MTARTGWGYATDRLRLLYTRHLVGSGIELGPGHHPYAVTLPLTDVRYVDRWDADENQALFPELTGGEFPKPDVVANLDTELLSAFDDASVDFVVASHLVEHVANPLALLADCHRVLTTGGTLLLMVPDMSRTSDGRRPETTLEHLVAEHSEGVTEVDDAHVEEYLRFVEGWTEGDTEERQSRFDLARRRSIHVHCWTEQGFFPVLEYLVGEMGCHFELVELVLAADLRASKEFGYVLRKRSPGADRHALAERLTATRDLLLTVRTAQGEWTEAAQRQSACDSLTAARAEVAARDRRIVSLEARLQRSEARWHRVRASPVYPVLRAGRRAQRAVAQWAAQRGS